MREKIFKDRARRNGEKSQVRVNDCRRSPSRSRINSARRRQFGRRLSCENRARVALVATSYYYRARCCRECSRGGYELPPPPSPPSSHLRDSAMRDAIHGRKYENPPLCASRALLEALPPCFCSRIRIYVYHIFSRYTALWVAALFQLKGRSCVYVFPFFFHPITRRIYLDFRGERWALIRRVGLPSGRRDLARWCETRVGRVTPMNRAVLLFRSQCATFHSFPR